MYIISASVLPSVLIGSGGLRKLKLHFDQEIFYASLGCWLATFS